MHLELQWRSGRFFHWHFGIDICQILWKIIRDRGNNHSTSRFPHSSLPTVLHAVIMLHYHSCIWQDHGFDPSYLTSCHNSVYWLQLVILPHVQQLLHSERDILCSQLDSWLMDSWLMDSWKVRSMINPFLRICSMFSKYFVGKVYQSRSPRTNSQSRTPSFL